MLTPGTVEAFSDLEMIILQSFINIAMDGSFNMIKQIILLNVDLISKVTCYVIALHDLDQTVRKPSPWETFLAD